MFRRSFFIIFVTLMKTTRFLLLAAIVAWLAAGCSPGLDFVENSVRPGSAEVSLSGGNLSMVFSSSAGSASVDLDATRKWTATFVNDRAKDWCSLSMDSGKRGVATITVSVKDNPEYDQRSASINFVCGDVQRTIVVTQKQKDAVLLSSSRQDVGVEGGQFTVEASANVPYTYEISKAAESWLSMVGVRSLSTKSWTFSVTANTSVNKREGEITFSSSAGKEVVKVYQDGETPTIVVSSSLEELTSGPASFSVEVRSNLDVTVDLPSWCDWLQEVKTKTVSTNTYRFSAEKNPTRQVRNAWIAFTNKDWGVSDTVYVMQDLRPIVVSNETLRASGRGWTVSFETAGSDPGSYRLAFAEDWLSRKGQEKLQDGSRFLVAVAPQPEDAAPRESYVLVYEQGYAEPDTVWVYQFERFPVFSYTTTKRTVTLPTIEEEDQLGFVRWGDDTLEPWQPGLTHNYAKGGQHTVSVEIRNKNRVALVGLENEMTINLRELRK